MRALGALLEDGVCFITAELLGAVEEEHVLLSSSSSTPEFCFSDEGMQNRCKSPSNIGIYGWLQQRNLSLGKSDQGWSTD